MEEGGRALLPSLPFLILRDSTFSDHHIGGEVDREGESRQHGLKGRAGQGRHERSSSLYGGCWLAQPVVT